jgi:D-ornithine 4,5-aminomutase subunit beta
MHAINTAKQALIGMDGLMDMIELKKDGYLPEKVRELKERAILFLEEIIENGGYFKAVQEGFFVDSGEYPERNGDGIARRIDGGIAADSIFEREKDYFAPVCAHFGYNNIPQEFKHACDAIEGCTLCRHEKIKFIDELDENDNVYKRMESVRENEAIVPEVQWKNDGYVSVTLFLPENELISQAAALEIGRNMNLTDVEVIHKQVMQESEGTLVEIKGRVNFSIDRYKLKIEEPKKVLNDEFIREYIRLNPVKIVAGTVGEDEHSVGLREIIDIKHGGIEKYGIQCEYLGTSCPIEKLIDAAVETKAQVIMASTIITHNDIHIKNMKKLHDLCVEKGVRDKLILISGGTQVSDEIARANGMDAGFGRGTHGNNVATFIVEEMQRRKE